MLTTYNKNIFQRKNKLIKEIYNLKHLYTTIFV